MESNTYFGVWSPKKLNGDYPVVLENVTFAAWYILEDYQDTVKNIEYKEGTWLLYIKDSSGEYWKTSSGLVLADQNNMGNVPIPGIYTKVQLDDRGNIVNASDIEYDDLPQKLLEEIQSFNDTNLEDKLFEISKSLFGVSIDNPIQFEWDHENKTIAVKLNIDNDTIKVDPLSYKLYAEGGGEGGGTGDCANHHHTVDQIDGLEAYLQNYIANIILVDQLRESLKDLVDGQTIIVNRQGKLSAIAMAVGEHTHKIEDIEGLDPQKVDTWASNQYFHNEGIDFNDGYLELKSLNIGEAANAINKSLTEIDTKAQTALDNMGKLEPVIPGGISCAKFEVCGQPKKLINTYSLKKEDCYNKLHIKTDSIIYLHASILSFYIDDVCVDIFDTEEINKVGPYLEGKINVTYYGDAYPLEKILQNKYLGYSFEYINDHLKEGKHSFKVIETLKKDNTTEESLPLTINTFESVILPITKIEKIKDNLDKKHYISGILSHENKSHFITLKLSSANFSECYSPLSQFQIKSSLNTDLIEVTDSKFFNGITEKVFQLQIPQGYNGKIDLEVKAYNSEDILGSVSSWKSEYINTDIDYFERLYRVSDKKAQDSNISIFYPFESEKPLTLENKECQFTNNLAIIASENYILKGIGPDYSSLQVPQSFVLCFSLEKEKTLQNIYFDILDKDKNPYNLTTFDCLEDIDIKIAISKSNSVSSWVDANIPWNGRESKDLYKDFNGLDLFRSTQKRRWVTFGLLPNDNIGKNLYIKIEMKTPSCSIDLISLEKSILECLNER